MSSSLHPSTRIQIRKARSGDRATIRQLYLGIKSPHARRIAIDEYFVALSEKNIIGCAAIRRIQNGGYLYGRAVVKEWRCQGIGTALLAERLQSLRHEGMRTAVGLVMFWNISVFRKMGFRIIRRADLPRQYVSLADFRNRRNRYCATLWIDL